MKVLILGANGMLGHKLCQVLTRRMEIWGTVRGRAGDYQALETFGRVHLLEGVSAEDATSFQRAVESVIPDAVVNAVGIVKQRDEAKHAIPSIQLNALFPHQLADMCDRIEARLIHISTDCVFSGQRGRYTEADLPDPVDLYGRTKLIGELNRQNCLTLRTSIVGWELTGRSSLLEWLASQRGSRIKGYRQAIYTGLSTSALATLIGDLLETRPDVTGLFHVASEPISKCELLEGLGKALGWDDIQIEPDDHFHCDRSLIGKRFEALTGWRAPGWDEMIAGLAAEWLIYAEWRGSRK